MPFQAYKTINTVPKAHETGYNMKIPSIELNIGNINCTHTILNKHIDTNNTTIGGTLFPVPLTVPANDCKMLIIN